MFDRLSDRIATAVVTGLDVAVEFATLGEYRLALPEAPAAPIAPPRPQRGARVFDGSELFEPASAASLPRPSTAAIREPAAPTPQVLAICAGRTRSKSTRPKPARPRPRSRGGAVRAPEQLCLWP